MRNLRPVAALVAWAGLASLAAAQQPGVTAAAEVERLERRLIAAIAALDMAGYREIVAEDYVATSASGEQTRGDVIAAYMSGKLRYENLRIDEVKVRVHGDTAVVAARAIRREAGQPAETAVRYLRVYARRDGRWQAVAQLATPVALPPPSPRPRRIPGTSPSVRPS